MVVKLDVRKIFLGRRRMLTEIYLQYGSYNLLVLSLATYYKEIY